MKIIKAVGISLLLSLFSFQLVAQKSYLEEADHKLYKEEKYFEAIEMYKKAYVKEKGRDVKAEIIYKIAESYRLSGQSEQAEVWYEKAIIAQYDEPKAHLYLADMKMNRGKYDEALVEYQKYAAKQPSDPRGKMGIESAEKAQQWNDKPKNLIVEPVVLLNSEYREYSATFADKRNTELIFTSTREGSTGSDLSDVTGEAFPDLYFSQQDKKGKWSEPVLVEGEEVNTEAGEGVPTFNSRRNRMYFTRCKVEKRGYLGCQILSAKKQGQKYAQVEVIPIASDSAIIAHPAMNPNDEILVFVSDMEGGQGGKDLWYIKEQSRNTWSEPINLGPEINTPDDEMFPTFRENGDLYFASNGHLGMGGMDIFHAEKQGDGKWGKVENLKAPINSNADDFGIIYVGNQEKGYFTSNREGGRGKDDLWEFSEPPILFILKGEVRDAETGEPLSAATVKLVGTDGTSAEKQTDVNGQFEFARNGDQSYINENTSYSITVSKPNYFNAKGKETTVGITESKIFAHLYELIPVKDEAMKLPEILYEFDSPELTEQAKDSLDYLYDIMVNNPKLIIELRANTDSRGSDAYNLKLSQARAESVVEYLASRGIDIERMKPKGYGEKNLLISDAEINKLATEEEREAAHQLNRRTEFSVISFDYVPKDDGSEGSLEDVEIETPTENQQEASPEEE